MFKFIKRRGVPRAALSVAVAALSFAVFSSALFRTISEKDNDADGAVIVMTENVAPRSLSASRSPTPDEQPENPGQTAAAVFSEAFEDQDAKLYINGAAYPYIVRMSGGEVYVSLDDIIKVLPALGGVTASDGDHVIRAGGRCVFCRNGIFTEKGIMIPLEAAAKLTGLELSCDGGEWFATGDGASIKSAEEFYDEEDLYWLSRIICAESMSESFTGKIAVGNVVLNRVTSPDFPDDVKGVVFDSRYGIVQFSPVAAGKIYVTPDPESVEAAKVCLEGASLSDDILYFMNPDIATTTWISDNREAVMTIGRHTFYS